MSVYNIKLSTDPRWNNVPVDTKLTLNREQLLGLLTIATALLGDEVNNYFRVYDRSVRPINIGAELARAGIILPVTPEQAFDITVSQGSSWLQELEYLGARPNKRYSGRLNTPYASYLIQFDSPQFIQGMRSLCAAFRVENEAENPNCQGYFFDFHDGDTSMESF